MAEKKTERKEASDSILSEEKTTIYKVPNDNNCAFHAVLGEEKEDGWCICLDPFAARETLADAIEQVACAKVHTPLLESVFYAVQAGVMGNISCNGPHFKALKKEYEKWERENKALLDDAWRLMEYALKQNLQTRAYLQKIASSKILNSKLSPSQQYCICFYEAIGQDLFKQIIQADPILDSINKVYKIVLKEVFDWGDKESSPRYQQMCKAAVDYAGHLRDPDVWLLELDIAILAEASGVRVVYHSEKNAKPSYLGPKNAAKEVTIKFDGKNHFERLKLHHKEPTPAPKPDKKIAEENKQPVSIAQIQPKPAAPPLSFWDSRNAILASVDGEFRRFLSWKFNDFLANKKIDTRSLQYTYVTSEDTEKLITEMRGIYKKIAKKDIEMKKVPGLVDQELEKLFKFESKEEKPESQQHSFFEFCDIVLEGFEARHILFIYGRFEEFFKKNGAKYVKVDIDTAKYKFQQYKKAYEEEKCSLIEMVELMEDELERILKLKVDAALPKKEKINVELTFRALTGIASNFCYLHEALEDPAITRFLSNPVEEKKTEKGKKSEATWKIVLKHAIETYHSLIKQGDLAAMVNLGVCYQYGAGVKKDIGKAIDYYRQAAKKGQAGAQYQLARCFEHGWGVPQDKQIGVEFYKAAASQGHIGAQYTLGTYYEQGAGGFPKDINKAIQYYHSAVKAGYSPALYALGRCYRDGLGVEENLDIAGKLFVAAARAGYKPAFYWAGWAYHFGYGGVVKPTRAKKFYREAAKNGDKNALKALQKLKATNTPDYGSDLPKAIINVWEGLEWAHDNKKNAYYPIMEEAFSELPLSEPEKRPLTLGYLVERNALKREMKSFIDLLYEKMKPVVNKHEIAQSISKLLQNLDVAVDHEYYDTFRKEIKSNFFEEFVKSLKETKSFLDTANKIFTENYEDYQNAFIQEDVIDSFERLRNMIRAFNPHCGNLDLFCQLLSDHGMAFLEPTLPSKEKIPEAAEVKSEVDPLPSKSLFSDLSAIILHELSSVTKDPADSKELFKMAENVQEENNQQQIFFDALFGKLTNSPSRISPSMLNFLRRFCESTFRIPEKRFDKALFESACEQLMNDLPGDYAALNEDQLERCLEKFLIAMKVFLRERFRERELELISAETLAHLMKQAFIKGNEPLPSAEDSKPTGPKKRYGDWAPNVHPALVTPRENGTYIRTLCNIAYDSFYEHIFAGRGLSEQEKSEICIEVFNRLLEQEEVKEMSATELSEAEREILLLINTAEAGGAIIADQKFIQATMFQGLKNIFVPMSRIHPDLSDFIKRTAWKNTCYRVFQGIAWGEEKLIVNTILQELAALEVKLIPYLKSIEKEILRPLAERAKKKETMSVEEIKAFVRGACTLLKEDASFLVPSYNVNPELLEKAKKGNADAQYELAQFYEGQNADIHHDPRPSVKAYKTEIRRWYRAAAEQEHENAQYALAKCLEQDASEKALSEAIHWYEELAKAGNIDIQYYLARIYAGSESLFSRCSDIPDMSKAFRWYQIAAKKGHVGALMRVASFCREAAEESKKLLPDEREESNVDSDEHLKEMFEYYLEAARKGNAMAQREVAICYRDGVGTSKNIIRTIYWYKKALDTGDAPGVQGRLDQIKQDFYRAGEEAVLQLKEWQKILLAELEGEVQEEVQAGLQKSQAKLAELQGKAREELWLKLREKLKLECRLELTPKFEEKLKKIRKEKQGYENLREAKCYQFGLCLPRDMEKALELYIKAADEGEIDALDYLLHERYWLEWRSKNPEIVTKYRKQLDMLRRSGVSDNHERKSLRILKLAECYRDGRSPQRSPFEAFQAYNMAAGSENPHAIYLLGYYREHGYLGDCPMTQHFEFAEKFYKIAAKEGHIGAKLALERREKIEKGDHKLELAESHALGLGKAQNIPQAIVLYKEAAEKGNAEAQYRLAEIYELLSGQFELTEALKWYALAAVQGHIGAQFALERYDALHLQDLAKTYPKMLEVDDKMEEREEEDNQNPAKKDPKSIKVKECKPSAPPSSIQFIQPPRVGGDGFMPSSTPPSCRIA